jgi:hypothetical protein
VNHLFKAFASIQTTATTTTTSTTSVRFNQLTDFILPSYKPTQIFKMPGITSERTPSRFDAIPGPLGLASASLEGKVALVTGAGKFAYSISHMCLHALETTLAVDR